MSAAVVDLGQIRDARDAAVRVGRAIAEERSAFIVGSIETWAARAYRTSNPIMANDPDMARAINMWARRKLRAEVRRALRPHMPAAGLADIVGMAEDGFWGRIRSLHVDTSIGAT